MAASQTTTTTTTTNICCRAEEGTPGIVGADHVAEPTTATTATTATTGEGGRRSGEDSVAPGTSTAAEEEVISGRERLKRHRREMAGRVWIPEKWGSEKLLDDWKDCSVIDRSLFPSGLSSAREALVEECRRANSGRVRIGNSC